MPDLTRETRLGGLVAGIDEVGRGPLAGPVVAAAVVIDPTRLPVALAEGLNDSKKLTAKRRQALAPLVEAHCVWGMGAASPREIDRINILNATFLAMERAMRMLERRLGRPPDHALIDGNRLPSGLRCPAQAVIGGDGASLSIAAASVIAKVRRDRVMAALDGRYPGFGWAANAGYGSAAHLAALDRQGPTVHHRASFAPVARLLARGG